MENLCHHSFHMKDKFATSQMSSLIGKGIKMIYSFVPTIPFKVMTVCDIPIYHGKVNTFTGVLNFLTFSNSVKNPNLFRRIQTFVAWILSGLMYNLLNCHQ